jgi:hypothetical protein
MDNMTPEELQHYEAALSGKIQFTAADKQALSALSARLGGDSGLILKVAGKCPDVVKDAMRYGPPHQ